MFKNRKNEVYIFKSLYVCEQCLDCREYKQAMWNLDCKIRLSSVDMSYNKGFNISI